MEDKQTGISIRFIRQFDAAKEREDSLRRWALRPHVLGNFLTGGIVRVTPPWRFALSDDDRAFLSTLHISAR